MNKRFLIGLLLPTFGACGQASVQLETRTFQLHYLSAREVSQIALPYVFQDRPGAPGVMSGSENTITVRETADNLEKIARVLQQFDRPQPRVRLIFHLIEADGAATADSSIRDVETVLRSLFRFRGYRLMSEGVVTGSESSETSQTLGGRMTAEHMTYRLSAGIVRIAGSGDSSTVELRVHLENSRGTSDFSTTVTVPVGQTAVLGNLQGQTGESALILTVHPELLKELP